MIAVGGDIAFEVAEDGVVLEEVGQGLGIGDVVDRDDLEIGSTTRGTVDIAPDAAKPVDANLYRHDVLLLVRLLDHFDSPGPPVAAVDSPPPTCSPAPARRAPSVRPEGAPTAARRSHGARAPVSAAGHREPSGVESLRAAAAQHAIACRGWRSHRWPVGSPG